MAIVLIIIFALALCDPSLARDHRGLLSTTVQEHINARLLQSRRIQQTVPFADNMQVFLDGEEDIVWDIDADDFETNGGNSAFDINTGPSFVDGDLVCSIFNDPNAKQTGNLRCSCLHNQLDCNSNGSICHEGECFTVRAQIGFSNDLTPQYDRLCVTYISGSSRDNCVEVSYDSTGTQLATCGVSFDGTECSSCTPCPEGDVDNQLVDLDCDNVEPAASTDGCARIQEIEAFEWMDSSASTQWVAASFLALLASMIML